MLALFRYLYLLTKVNDCGNVGMFLFESGNCKCKQRRVCRKVDREGTTTNGICKAFGASSTSIGSEVEEEEVEVVEVVVVVVVSDFQNSKATQEQCSKSYNTEKKKIVSITLFGLV